MYNLNIIKKSIFMLTVISMVGFYFLCAVKSITLFDIEVDFKMLTIFYIFVFLMNYNSIYKEKIWSCYILSYVAFMPIIFSLGCSISNFNTIPSGYAIINVTTNICFFIMLYLNNIYRYILENKKN